MEARHRTLFSNVLAWAVFISPMIYFLVNKYLYLIFAYSVCIIGLLVFSISNIKWKMETAGEHWNDFYLSVDKIRKKINKKFINRIHI
jgi:hypothetical protein